MITREVLITDAEFKIIEEPDLSYTPETIDELNKLEIFLEETKHMSSEEFREIIKNCPKK